MRRDKHAMTFVGFEIAGLADPEDGRAEVAARTGAKPHTPATSR
jgi:hypothetical protein